jgi:hypothetical protein
MPDRNQNLPNEGRYELNSSPNADDYVLVPVEGSPIPGHMVQMPKEDVPQEQQEEEE